MSHSWATQVDSVGQLTPTQAAAFLDRRAKDLADTHQAATAEDDALWTAILARIAALIAVIDPLGTAAIRTTLRVSGAHPGYPSVHMNLSMSFVRGSGTGSQHVWQMNNTGHLTAAEEALLRADMQADASVMGGAYSANDTLVFDALVASARALIIFVDPGTTASEVDTTFSAQVGVYDLNAVSFNLGVGVSHAGAASPTVVSPPTITSDQNNYSPADLATAAMLRLSSSAARSITGLAAPNPPDGRTLIIHNVGLFNIGLVNASPLSAAGNRFLTTANITIAPNGAVILTYDPISLRWRVAGLR